MTHAEMYRLDPIQMRAQRCFIAARMASNFTCKVAVRSLGMEHASKARMNNLRVSRQGLKAKLGFHIQIHSLPSTSIVKYVFRQGWVEKGLMLVHCKFQDWKKLD